MRQFSLRIIVLIVVFSLSVITLSAQAEVKSKKAHGSEAVFGTVVSVDKAAKSIVVKSSKDGQDMTFTVSEKAVSSLKAGEEVKVVKKTNSNAAESVTVIKTAARRIK